MGKLLSRNEIIEKYEKTRKPKERKLSGNNFNYWVKQICRLEPDDKEIRGRFVVDIYHPSCIKKLKQAMRGS